MPYKFRTISAKEPYTKWHICRKRLWIHTHPKRGVYTHVWPHIWPHIWTHVCTHFWKRQDTGKLTRTQTHACIYIYVHIWTLIWTHVYSHLRKKKAIYQKIPKTSSDTQTRVHTHMNMYMNTCICSFERNSYSHFKGNAYTRIKKKKEARFKMSMGWLRYSFSKRPIILSKRPII